MIEKSIKLTTLFGSFLLFNGIVYLVIFYQRFGIDIFSYLSFTEVLTSFIDSLQVILQFFIVYLLHLFLTTFLTFKSIASKNISDEEKSDLIDEKQIKLESKISNAIFIQLAISSVLTILIILSIIKINLFLIYIFSITFFNVFQSISEYFRQYFGNYFNKRFGNCILVFNMFIFPFIIFTIVYAFYNAHKIVNSPKIISIEYNDNTIFKCNKIGKSNNYIFVYYPDSLKSSSISLAEVKKINYYLK